MSLNFQNLNSRMSKRENLREMLTGRSTTRQFQELNTILNNFNLDGVSFIGKDKGPSRRTGDSPDRVRDLLVTSYSQEKRKRDK